MKPLILLALILTACTREMPENKTCWVCVSEVVITKPGCPGDSASATYEQCRWTASEARAWEKRQTYTDTGANGYRAVTRTVCKQQTY